MIQQHVHTKQTSPLEGVLLIVEMFMGLMIAVIGANAVVKFTGIQYLAYAVWIAVVAVAALLLRGRILEFRYTVSDGVLYVERLYGKQSRVLTQVPLSKIKEFAPEKEVLDKYKDAARTVTKTVLPTCDIPHMALAYKNEDTLQVVVMQPDETMKQAIESGMRPS
jgi:membrane protein YdbS with pleckstrin-like domain